MQIMEAKWASGRIPGMTPEEEAELLGRVVAADEQIEDSKKELRERVSEAMKHGVPAATIAKRLGVSRSRVYQIRDGR